MGWFEEQLEVRRKSDQKILEDSFIINLANKYCIFVTDVI